MAAFDLRDLSIPVIVAPMAGGPTTPELAAAATNTGGLGFLAAGYLTAEAMAERISAARRLTSGPLGVNLFAPQPNIAKSDEIELYAKQLATEIARYGAEPGPPRFNDDDWAAKLELVADLRPELVSFTFGGPTPQECARLRQCGITTVATVTTMAEARQAAATGVDALAVQGPGAGGHRGTYDPAATPAAGSLAELLAEVLAHTDLPVVAAGGLMTGDDIAAVIDAGAVGAQLGTAFLLADESGSSSVHRAALTDPRFVETVVTKAFSGRYARGLDNRFVNDHESQAPLGYPQVHYMTGPLRAAAVRAGDPDGTNVWAGTGFRKICSGSVAEIMGRLV
jgi:nitronate monooxygenase